MNKIKITHIITGLDLGGAETMLYKLLCNMNKIKYDINVISMMDEGVYGKKIKELGFNVYTLNMSTKKINIKSFIKAKKYIANTDIIQTWMYHSDLLGYILFKTSKAKKIIWGIRRSNLDPKYNKKSTLLVAKINSILSKNVDSIISCSIKAKEVHEKFGFSGKNLRIIPNGFELENFKNNKLARKYLSNILKIDHEIPYIIHVGRWNILKDYDNLLNALRIVKQKQIKFHAILVGTNINYKNKNLVNSIKNNELFDDITLLDRRNDIPMLMAGSDVLVSSSKDEGFPNVIGEAMACETPCVVTDAGDSAYIVGETGIVVPPTNPKALAKGIIEMLNKSNKERSYLGKLARQRVIDNFDIKKVTKQFEELYNI